MTLDDLGKIVGPLVAIAGIIYGGLQRRDARRAAERTERREAENERRAVDTAAKAATAAERLEQREEFEALVSGLVAVNGELREEFNRMRRLVDDCERRGAEQEQAHRRSLSALQDAYDRLRASGA